VAPFALLFLGHGNSRVPRVILDERYSVLTTLDSPFRSWRGTRFATLSAAPRYRSLSPSGKPQFRNIACEIARRRHDVFPDAFPRAFRDAPGVPENARRASVRNNCVNISATFIWRNAIGGTTRRENVGCSARKLPYRPVILDGYRE